MVQSEYLSPPKIHKPAYDCAEVVKVSGFTAGATVKVFANHKELIGSAEPFIAWWYIRTNRPLKANDSLTAIQKVGSDESSPTPQPVVVENPPGTIVDVSHDPPDFRIDPLSEPQLLEPIYHCQQVIETTAVLPGAWVEVTEYPADGEPLLGRETTPTDTIWVSTPRLNEGQALYARQVFCSSNESPFTSRFLVQALPLKLATPSVTQESLIVGAEVILVRGLITGAEVSIFAGQKRIAGGIASSANTVFSTTEAIKPNVEYWAEQKLCELKSDPPTDGGIGALTSLPEPHLRTPICPGSDSVVVENTVLGAVVKVFVNGKQWGQVTAIGKETLILLGNNNHFRTNHLVVATQEIGPIGPMKSAKEIVGQAGDHGDPQILGGHPFFEAAPGEQPIPGPVFLRGSRTPAGAGPVFRISACGAERVDLIIERPAEGSFPVKLIEEPSGHYTGVWDWSSSSGRPSIPTSRELLSQIMVGKYIAHFTVVDSSDKWSRKLPFFVIFDPSEVLAPKRFTFDHTGIWFGTVRGALEALSYALHLSDNRVFGWAMDVIGGQTNPWNATELLLQEEHNKFDYSLEDHCRDVLDLLENETSAQCAEDANMLTALLRASGIPAHPVTADARVEFGDANWNFDTWVEVRLKGPHGERWYALHSHQKSGAPKGPIPRSLAGIDWGEASRMKNDMIIMAGETWLASELNDSEPEVSYNWNTPCKRPSKSLNAKHWIENLTDDQLDSYWSKPFWECSPNYVTPISVTLVSGQFLAGDMLSGTVEIHTSSQRLVMGELSLLLAESKIDSKVFADRLHSILTREIRLSRGERERLSIPFQVRLPSTICADDEIMVVANFGDARVIAYVNIAPSFDLEPNIPSTVEVGETFLLQIKVTNRLDRPLTGVILELDLPFACVIERPTSTRARDYAHPDVRSLPPVEPGATANVEWFLRAVSPATPAAIRIKASTPGLGERRISVATQIPDFRPLDYIGPIVPPTYARQLIIEG
jgi:hypothetical protein